MTALTEVEGLGRADRCVVSTAHRAPWTLRFVWHHIQPQVCGGQTVPGNLVALCDNCHYTIHILMWIMGQSEPPRPGWGLIRQRRLAAKGYARCVQAGTVALIPKEADPPG